MIISQGGFLIEMSVVEGLGASGIAVAVFGLGPKYRVAASSTAEKK